MHISDVFQPIKKSWNISHIWQISFTQQLSPKQLEALFSGDHKSGNCTNEPWFSALFRKKLPSSKCKGGASTGAGEIDCRVHFCGEVPQGRCRRKGW